MNGYRRSAEWQLRCEEAAAAMLGSTQAATSDAAMNSSRERGMPAKTPDIR
jgi:hypothetical protein